VVGKDPEWATFQDETEVADGGEHCQQFSIEG
jgi:hypothetical protein